MLLWPPMVTFEEMSAWTADEIQAHIQAALPSTILFSFGLDKDGGVWSVRFDRIEQDGSIVGLWSDTGFEHRILLLNAYGWIWNQIAPRPDHASPWIRRREITAEAVTRRVVFGHVPDPEDLDPDEVDSVYAKARTGQ